MNHSIEIIGTSLFALAMLHTFLAASILKLSHRFEKGSMPEAALHLLGEVEVVFGFWGGVLLVFMALVASPAEALKYQTGLNFTEPIFVFCIMVVAATAPILRFIESLIGLLSRFLQKILPISSAVADFFVILSFGPLVGSLITEPAAMTVSALLLASRIRSPGGWFIYSLLAVLFVNISIGGALTSFAAPPILMVASTWQWNTAFVFNHFGWKALLAVLLNALIFVLIHRNRLSLVCWSADERKAKELQSNDVAASIPLWITLTQFIFLAAVVFSAHYPSLCAGVFLFFIGFTQVTRKFQTELRIKQSLLVAFFLAGIVMFGPLQRWWLEPILQSLNSLVLGGAAVVLTAFTDNAALTFLGSQIPGLSDESKYYLVAGAIAGGGLTIIANAPNAAGYSVLNRYFPDGLNAGKLALHASWPTLIAIAFLAFY
jgi:hypothetical protein